MHFSFETAQQSLRNSSLLNSRSALEQPLVLHNGTALPTLEHSSALFNTVAVH
jgi:hypothetical protein